MSGLTISIKELEWVFPGGRCIYFTGASELPRGGDRGAVSSAPKRGTAELGIAMHSHRDSGMTVRRRNRGNVSPDSSTIAPKRA
jgi:hypothetical protein